MKKAYWLTFAFVLVFLLASCAIQSESINMQTNPQIMNTTAPAETNTTVGDEYREPMDVFLIESTSQLDMLRNLVADEESDIFIRGLGNREQVISFLTIIDSLPVPTVEDVEVFNIMYFPHNEEIYFLFQFDDGYWYRFEFSLNETRSNEIREDIRNSGITEIVMEDLGDIKISILKREDFSELEKFAKHYAEIWLDINGRLVKVVHRNNYADISDIDPIQLLAKIYITSLTE